jgi:hypothetical protein
VTAPPFSATSPRARWPVPRSTARSQAGRWNSAAAASRDEAFDPRRLVGWRKSTARTFRASGRTGRSSEGPGGRRLRIDPRRFAIGEHVHPPQANSWISWRSLGAIWSRLV